MEQVEVVKYQMYRDGGTTEYRDVFNRKYFISSPQFNDPNIYSDHPCHISKNQAYRDDLLLKGIELKIVDKFS